MNQPIRDQGRSATALASINAVRDLLSTHEADARIDLRDLAEIIWDDVVAPLLVAPSDAELDAAMLKAPSPCTWCGQCDGDLDCAGCIDLEHAARRQAVRTLFATTGSGEP